MAWPAAPTAGLARTQSSIQPGNRARFPARLRCKPRLARSLQSKLQAAEPGAKSVAKHEEKPSGSDRGYLPTLLSADVPRPCDCARAGAGRSKPRPYKTDRTG